MRGRGVGRRNSDIDIESFWLPGASIFPSRSRLPHDIPPPELSEKHSLTQSTFNNLLNYLKMLFFRFV